MDSRIKVWKNIILIIFVIVSACSHKNIEKSPLEKEYESLHNIKLIDTFSNELRFVPCNYITEIKFFPIYIGRQKNSLLLTYTLQDKNYLSSGNYKPADSSDLIIFVDTSKIVGSAYNFNVLPPPPPPYFTEKEIIEWETKTKKERGKLFRGGLKSYPVIIKNMKNDTLFMGYEFEELPIIIEAKDSIGKWGPITRNSIMKCVHSSIYYFLSPKEILITNCMLFEGSYYTKMRLVFGNRLKIYSNEFYGTIDYKQFDEIK